MVDKPYGNMELPSFSEHEPHADLLVLISPSIRLSLNTRMLNFTQFLREVFFKGTKAGTHGGLYAEIFRNPGADDFKTCGGTSKSHEIGAVISGKSLYIWDRDFAEHHDVKTVIPSVKPFTPLYLYYNPATKSVKVTLAAFGMSPEDYYRNKETIVATCRKHPAFRWFNKVTGND